ncbi:MAG: hypothetical protein V1707_01160 [bacterium]
MALSVIRQISTLLEEPKRCLVLAVPAPRPDQLASSIGLSILLKNIGCQTDLIIPNFPPDHHLHWLPNINIIQPDITSISSLVIGLPVPAGQTVDIKQREQDEQMEIIVTTQQPLTPQSLSIRQEQRFDLVFTIGVRELKQLETIYDRYPDIFHHLPVINIDTDISNEQYGTINWIETSSTLPELICQIGLAITTDNSFTKEASTNLYAALIYATSAFRSQKVTSSTLAIASELLRLNADKNLVITKLHQTKGITAFRLWGQILSRLDIEERLNLAVALVDDPADNDPHNLSTAIDELIITHQGVETVCLGMLIGDLLTIVVHAKHPGLQQLICQSFGLPERTTLLFRTDIPFPLVKQKVSAIIQLFRGG